MVISSIFEAKIKQTHMFYKLDIFLDSEAKFKHFN